MWTQVLILQLLRTRRIPFLQSRSSAPVMAVTLLGILLFSALTVSPLGQAIGMTGLPPLYFAFLAVIVIGYLLTVTIAKKAYQKWHQDLLRGGKGFEEGYQSDPG